MKTPMVTDVDFTVMDGAAEAQRTSCDDTPMLRCAACCDVMCEYP